MHVCYKEKLRSNHSREPKYRLMNKLQRRCKRPLHNQGWYKYRYCFSLHPYYHCSYITPSVSQKRAVQHIFERNDVSNMKIYRGGQERHIREEVYVRPVHWSNYEYTSTTGRPGCGTFPRLASDNIYIFDMLNEIPTLAP